MPSGTGCRRCPWNTLEFKPQSSFEPIDDKVGGGPFGFKACEWTDDTSMALFLAESLIERKGFDRKLIINSTRGSTACEFSKTKTPGQQWPLFRF